MTGTPMATDLDSDGARLEAGHHPVAGPVSALPALRNRQLVELHMHHDVQRVVNLDRLQQTLSQPFTNRTNTIPPRFAEHL